MLPIRLRRLCNKVVTQTFVIPHHSLTEMKVNVSGIVCWLIVDFRHLISFVCVCVSSVCVCVSQATEDLSPVTFPSIWNPHNDSGNDTCIYSRSGWNCVDSDHCLLFFCIFNSSFHKCVDCVVQYQEQEKEIWDEFVVVVPDSSGEESCLTLSQSHLSEWQTTAVCTSTTKKMIWWLLTTPWLLATFHYL